MSSTQAPSTPGPTRLRQALGTFATGVTVVTGLDATGPVGFACQSFASVSLDPPLVLFCADHRSRSWARIREAGRFGVNVLAEQQSELCRRFGTPGGAKFTDLAWDLSDWSTPALRGVLARVHADVEAVHPSGDHDVVIGRVLEVERVCDRPPMLFFRSNYGTFA
ncbi:flavin reductase family protein [Saccharopolyspora rosea]|uniref:Flavin reductase family protein n=1 Tax=Saccharopolyspora rosea TaxID=524884 RepID=A0ABW3FRR1_9PSEU|nr:flavin reductase family protein [Saccharopolyspora rosea]